jgi:hypothetical protein
MLNHITKSEKFAVMRGKKKGVLNWGEKFLKIKTFYR